MNTLTHDDNAPVEPVHAVPKPPKRGRPPLMITLLAVIVTLALTVESASAGTYLFYDRDMVKQSQNSTQIWGNVQFSYDSSNSDNRFARIRVGAQQTWRGRPFCVGLQLLALTERVSRTYGGSVGGGWSLTGPSASGSVTYSRTTQQGRTSDGIFWKCPRSNRFIRNYASVNDYWNARVDGKLTAIAVKGCITDDPLNLNRRWCTNWDVNDFGGR